MSPVSVVTSSQQAASQKGFVQALKVLSNSPLSATHRYEVCAPTGSSLSETGNTGTTCWLFTEKTEFSNVFKFVFILVKPERT